jgi:hypothetical protein
MSLLYYLVSPDDLNELRGCFKVELQLIVASVMTAAVLAVPAFYTNSWGIRYQPTRKSTPPIGCLAHLMSEFAVHDVGFQRRKAAVPHIEASTMHGPCSIEYLNVDQGASPRFGIRYPIAAVLTVGTPQKTVSLCDLRLPYCGRGPHSHSIAGVVLDGNAPDSCV